MTPQLAFYRFEMRRQLPALITSCLFLLILPFLSIVQGSWPYWQGEVGEYLTYLTCYLLAPFVGSWLAAHGWASDRSRRTLEWLVARPLRTNQLFWIRSLAMATSIVIWFAVAYLLMLPVLRTLNSPDNGLVYNLVINLGLAVGFGSFFSALLSRPGSAVMASVGALYCFWIVWISLVFRMLLAPVRRDWVHQIGQTAYTALATAIELVIPVAILLLAAWAMIKICPGDSRRTVRGLRTLGIGGLAYSAFLIAMATFF